jgi:hypothetical protein
MPKGSLFTDTFEQLAELGQSTVKKSGQAVVQTFSPLKILENAVGVKPSPQDKGIEQLEKGRSKKQNYTPLPTDRFQESFKDQDKAKLQAFRNKLFQLSRSADERAVQEKQRNKEEKKQREMHEKGEKRKKEDEKKRATAEPIPMGKVRRSIFSPKKAAQRQQTEVRPAAGKQ